MASSSLRSTIRRNSASGISLPISSVAAQAATTTTPTPPASSVSRPLIRTIEKGSSSTIASPTRKAVSTAARTVGSSVSRI